MMSAELHARTSPNVAQNKHDHMRVVLMSNVLVLKSVLIVFCSLGPGPWMQERIGCTVGPTKPAMCLSG